MKPTETKVDDIISAMEEAADEYDEMESQTSMLSVGDVVKMQDDTIGIIEDRDKEGYHVRVYATAGPHMEPTDKVVYQKADEVEQYRNTEKGGYVSFGDTFGIVSETKDDRVMVNVCIKDSNGRFKATGYIADVDTDDVKTVAPFDYDKGHANVIMVKAKKASVDIDEAAGVATIKGWGSTYGNVDLGGDRVNKGAFTQTLNHHGGKIKLMLDHGSMTKDIAGVAFLKEEDNGLWVEAKMPIKAPDLKSVLEKVKFLVDNDVDMGFSMGYVAKKYDVDSMGVRDLYEVALGEMSLTPWPMDTNSVVVEAKSMKMRGKVAHERFKISKKHKDAPKGNPGASEDALHGSLLEIKNFLNPK